MTVYSSLQISLFAKQIALAYMYTSWVQGPALFSLRVWFTTLKNWSFCFCLLSLLKDQHGLSWVIDVPLMIWEAARSDLLWSSSALSPAAGPGQTIPACSSLGLKCLGIGEQGSSSNLRLTASIKGFEQNGLNWVVQVGINEDNHYRFFDASKKRCLTWVRKEMKMVG